MTQINKENWAEFFPSFLARTLDPTLAFVAFDLEMTGINLGGTDFNSNNAWADSPAERFVKVAKVASRFSICQLGICLFFQTSGNPDALECDAYNIDTFDARRDLAASPGALSFLAANGFDFNEWIKRGVPIVNAADEKRLRKRHARSIEEAHTMVRAAEEAKWNAATNDDGGGSGEDNADKAEIGVEEGNEPAAKRAAVGIEKPTAAAPTNQERHKMTLQYAADQEVADAALKALRVWLAELTLARKVAAATEFRVAAAVDDDDDDEPMASSSADSAPLEVELGPFPWAGLRKYMYQELETDPAFAGLVTEKRPGDKIAVLALTSAQAKERAQAQEAAAGADLVASLGARPVFTALVEAAGRGVPVVGHNCLADLCFLLQAFDAPILEPESATSRAAALSAGQGDEASQEALAPSDPAALYEAWKARVHCLFPRVIDTKYVAVFGAHAEWWAGGPTSLESLVETFDATPKAVESDALPVADAVNAAALKSAPPNDGGSTEESASNKLKLVVTGGRYAPGSAAYHEAGWDALCTGRVLVRLIEASTAHAQGSQSLQADQSGLNNHSHSSFSQQLGALTSARNALNLMRSPYVVSLGASSDGPAPGERNATEVAKRAASATDSVSAGARELAAPGSGGVINWLRSMVGLESDKSAHDAPQKRPRPITTNFFGV